MPFHPPLSLTADRIPDEATRALFRAVLRGDQSAEAPLLDRLRELGQDGQADSLAAALGLAKRLPPRGMRGPKKSSEVH